MRYVNVALALHHHQPVGNLPHILEECYQKCYAPVLRAIERQPNLKFNLSYSGPLLLFFAERHPEFLEKLRQLTAARRIELLATGFYEPILPEIEEDDRQGQLRLTLKWLEEHLGARPRGAWLAEGVWDNSLAKTFRQAELEFSIAQHERLLQAGVAEAQLHGYHLTEYFGDVLRLFPSDPNLHRLLPYGDAEELTAYLRRMANRGLGLTLTFSDHAERWGVWPGSFEKIQRSGAMEKMLAALNDADDWLRLKLFSEVIDSEPPRGRCYLPAGAGVELGMWSLPDESRRHFARARDNLHQRHDADRFLPFFRAGSWGGFRGRYFESNLMEKKGLWLKRQLPAAVLPEAELRRARELLWQAQCNTAYWHGASDGIYLPHLRQAIWQRLLAAQQIIRGTAEGWRVERGDFIADGQEQVLACHRRVCFGVSPADGGSCFEWSLPLKGWNLANTLTRRPESDPLAPDEDQAIGAPVDAYERHLFQERFISRHMTAAELQRGEFRDGGDFVGGAYRLVGAELNGSGGGAEIELERLGTYSANDVGQPLRLGKIYAWDSDGATLRVRYRLTNESPLPLNTCFAVELNLGTAPAGTNTHRLTQPWYEDSVVTLALDLPPGRLTLSGGAPLTVWSYPINTPGAADGPLPFIRQGNCLLCGWPLDLPPGKTAECELTLTLSDEC